MEVKRYSAVSYAGYGGRAPGAPGAPRATVQRVELSGHGGRDRRHVGEVSMPWGKIAEVPDAPGFTSC
jgi:hypothetical protein